jgi:hypothetical protein
LSPYCPAPFLSIIFKTKVQQHTKTEELQEYEIEEVFSFLLENYKGVEKGK